MRLRPELQWQEAPAPTRVAPYSLAITADVVVGDEELATGRLVLLHDPAHFAYPTYAKAAIQRRENLRRSAGELKAQLDDAQAMLGEAFEELKKVEMLDERDKAHEKADANAREQAELDRIAAMRFSSGGAPA